VRKEMSVPKHKPQSFDKDQLLEEMMLEHGNGVLYLAYSYVKDRLIAEDIAQEVFLRAYTHLDSFQWDATIKTWLYRITVNRCKDYLKSWSYRSTILSNVIELAMGRQNENETELILIDKDEKLSLAQNIFSLPLKYREVIYLFYYQELSLNEISDLLEINMNTLKSRMKRAKELLKKEMDLGGYQ
jgi:RNA polymerase sigma-70 factor, ECF subfamily